MNLKSLSALVLALLAGVTAAPSLAADAKTPAAALTGEITPKAYVFDYFDGVGADRTSFLERYRAQKGWNGDTRGGLFLDLDFDVKYQPDDKTTFTAKRWGEGQYRHGGAAQWDNERLKFTADYNFFRRSTGGIDYLFSPNLVPGGTDSAYYPLGSTNTNSGYAAKFNDDSNRTMYHVNRFAYGLGFTLKPGVLGTTTSLAINFDGYLRYGQRRQTYALGGSDVAKTPVAPTTDFVLQRWRGFAENVDENMNRLSWNLTASPKNVLSLAYTGSVETYDNRAKDYTHRDIPLVAPYFYNPTADQTRPLGFTPDSTLGSHALKVSKTVGTTLVAAGYNTAKLEQNSFTQPQIRLGYTTGQVQTTNSFVDFDSAVTPMVGLQGHFRFGQRDNESSFPVVGLLSATTAQTLGVRTNRIESKNYGLAAVLRPRGLNSTVTVGWRADDKSRDLTYHATEIIRSVSTYRSDTDTDEIYARWSALNLKGITLRLTSSYAWADRTGLVTEPSQALGLKAALNYTAPNGTLFSSYYSVKDRENDNHGWTDKAVATPLSYAQDLNSTVHSGGVALNWKPSPEANAYLGLDWTRMDASVLFYESSRRRFEATTTFGLRDTVGSVVDNFLVSVGGDYKASRQTTLNWSYTLAKADGNLASGYVANQLNKIDDTLDNVLHTLELGARYDLAKNRQLRVGYRYDEYEDSAYPVLSGGVHSLMLAVTFRL
jgi:hypothetical protein